MEQITVGSVCSGIEAASVAWIPLGFQFEWYSEIAEFPSKILAEKYPDTPNLGDMQTLPQKILQHQIPAPDVICGGTPCQAFSLAGWKNGLDDDRGNLTLQFVDIVEANDTVRLANRQSRSIVFWENVEGVLTDKTNAFGCFVSSLAGLSETIVMKKWSNSGIIRGTKRNIAWRVLDAKFFGLPQQRRRLYLIAGGTDFFPENILFENGMPQFTEFPKNKLYFQKECHQFEIFREYTDCLYSAYGTKWNGNAAANNGSLFIVQDGNIRRLSPLECERLMGFPDNYTELRGAKKTNRYQVIGNSWAVPVVKWIGSQLISHMSDESSVIPAVFFNTLYNAPSNSSYLNLGKNIVSLGDGRILNCTAIPVSPSFGSLESIVSPDAPSSIYISPTGCFGIVRRSQERNTVINNRLREVLLSISSKSSIEEIEKRSRVQRRGQYSTFDYAYTLPI